MQLQISVAAGVGAAPTALAAFDAALCDIGVANFNLIRLSSVIPPGSVVTRSPGRLFPCGEWGDRLYVVISDARSDVPGTEVWAGLGWIRDPDTGRGLLVEHQAPSEAEVTADIRASLISLRRGRGSVGERLTEQQLMTAGVTCTAEPVSALVLAMFAVEPWHPGSA